MWCLVLSFFEHTYSFLQPDLLLQRDLEDSGAHFQDCCLRLRFDTRTGFLACLQFPLPVGGAEVSLPRTLLYPLSPMSAPHSPQVSLCGVHAGVRVCLLCLSPLPPSPQLRFLAMEDTYSAKQLPWNAGWRQRYKVGVRVFLDRGS